MASHPNESKSAKRNGDGGWKKGPLPKDTYGWGGVVPVGAVKTGGFYFADFQGDKVVTIGGGADGQDATLKPEEVAWFNNTLTLPPAYEGK